MNFYDRLLHDVATIKDYGGMQCKLSVVKTMKNPEFDVKPIPKRSKGTVNDEKTSENVSRTKSKIFELVYCNPWDYFCTFTIAKTKGDRYDIDDFRKRYSQWLRDYKKKFGCDIKYLHIPEQHKNGAWHFHSFIYGLSVDRLREFKQTEKLPYRLLELIRQRNENNLKIFDWPDYQEKFGFCTLEQVMNKEACSKYVTKYITKDLARSITEVNAHLYYCSKGLQRAQIIKRGQLLEQPTSWDFEGEYAKCKFYRSDSLDYLCKIVD